MDSFSLSLSLFLLQDAADHRTKLLRTLRYLWTHEAHRHAFRRFAEEPERFENFVNGYVVCIVYYVICTMYCVLSLSMGTLCV